MQVQAQTKDTLKSTENSAPDFLDVMDKIVVDVMVDAAMGRLDSLEGNAFEQETKRRIFAVYTQAEIETMVADLPKDSFMKQSSRIDNYKNLIAYHKTTFLPETTAIRAKLKNSIPPEDLFSLVNIRNDYRRDLEEHYAKRRSHLPTPQNPPSKRDEARSAELDLTIEYHNMVPQISSQMANKNWYKKVLEIAGKTTALSADDQQILSDLREARYRLYFEGLGRMLTNLSVIGNPREPELAAVIELLLIEE